MRVAYGGIRAESAYTTTQAFHTETNDKYEQGSKTGGSFGRTVSFRASNSNPIYGNSTTVQPKSYTVLYIMKIKA